MVKVFIGTKTNQLLDPSDTDKKVFSVSVGGSLKQDYLGSFAMSVWGVRYIDR